MNDGTIANAELNDGNHRGGISAAADQWVQGAHASADRAHAIVASSTFTADPLLHPLRFWMDRLQIRADVALAPYAQLMQELLNPHGHLAENRNGFNVLLVRLDDWLRDRAQHSGTDNIEHIRRVTRDFCEGIRVLRTRTSAYLLVIFCPPSSGLAEPCRQPLEEIQRELVSWLRTLAHTSCWTHDDLVHLYPVTRVEDERTDRVGHIPYTTEYFAAIATMLARRIAVLLKPPYKVIALDCDNTLWKGVCGEDGPAGVELTSAHLELQRMLVRQHDAGMLLCLCSKNNQSDVDAVFKNRRDMPLREEHFICSRVNWSPKSSNLQSLARELDLSLDSFIFIDDSAVECAEVTAHCPPVLTLQLPSTQKEIAHFLNHAWTFDHVATTADAKQRTAQYKQNRARSKALEEATNLEDFLASLELVVSVTPMQPEHLARVAELVQRTSQFNLSGIRRRANEIEALSSSGDLDVLVVHVRDRFGDYGLVGAVLVRSGPASLEVDTFVLSCRVLGRGVEHRVVNELGLRARKAGLARIVLRLRPTSRNAPAQAFLDTALGSFGYAVSSDASGERTFSIPSDIAETLQTKLAAATTRRAAAASTVASNDGQYAATKWHEIAYRLSRMEDVVAEMNRGRMREHRRQGEYVAPRTTTEAAVARIWAEVLGLPDVGLQEDFFELGGDSLQAVQVIAAIGSELGREVAIYEFFEAPTVEAVAGTLAEAASCESPIETVSRVERLSLSSAQQRLWFIDRLEGGSSAYHIPISLRLEGELDLVALQFALDALLARHETLRTVFVQLDGQPLQRILPTRNFELRCVDFSVQTVYEREAELLKHIREELSAPFELSTGPLVRGRLLKLSNREHVLLITMHHIISDGWSVGVLVQELATLYTALKEERPNPLPPLPIQYADYAQWQQRWRTGTQLQDQLAYWKQHLQGAPELLELTTDRQRPPVQSYRGAGVRVALGSELAVDLRSLSRRHNCTLAMTLCCAWSILMSRLSGQEDIVIGMPVANRRRTEVEGLIGLFVNTLAVRVRLQGDPSVAELLRRVKETMVAAYAHQDAPFEEVVEAVQPIRTLSHSPVFQVMFVLHNTPRSVVQIPALTLIEQEVPLCTSKFDLTLSLQESAEDIAGSLNYASELFDATTMQRWSECLKNVLRAMVLEAHARVSDLPVMSLEELEQVTQRFNATRAAYPQEKLIQELFEEQVTRRPDAAAVVCGTQSLTFEKLNGRANQLARYLRELGVAADEPVGICVERSAEMVVGLLGILKAGGAYVPLDPDYPSERVAYMLDDAKPRVLLTQQHLMDRLSSMAGSVIAIDRDWSEVAQYPAANLKSRALGMRSNQLAYVIYTSGSTGKPKGVMIEHRNLTSLWRGLEQIYQECGGCERVAVNASFNFDASVKQFVQLLSGRTIVLVPQDYRWDAAKLLTFLAEQKIECIDCTPSQLKSWISAGLLEHSELSLRAVLIGGEPIDAELWHTLARSRHAAYYNVYGPTESTVDATFARLTCDTKPHIGHPMENRSIYILGRHGEPVPIGVAGELYIGGAGVARGYLKRPELTAERFLRNPFVADQQERMYRTGDVGRWRADGSIEYAGRNDHQVKIRGFRIELGEIETVLVRHDQITEAVVIVREDLPGERRLVAYVVLDTEESTGTLSTESLREALKAALPEYMVPSAFVVLDGIPLTQNGKLDWRALPAPELGADATRQFEPPRGEVEEILAAVWHGLLHAERVGRHDNFFQLGGHSLLIMQMLERLRRVGLATEVRRVFESPTLAELASVLTSEVVGNIAVPPNLIPAGCEAIEPSMLPLIELEPAHISQIVRAVPDGAPNIQDIYPLDPLQEGILFHHLLNDRSGDTYIVSIALRVSSRERLRELIAALQAVIDRHDILRTAVFWDQLPRPLQVVCRSATLPVEETTLADGRDAFDQVKEWMRPEQQRMDMSRAPLLRLRIAAAGEGKWYAVLQSHHITSDHVTLESITSEVQAHMEGRAQELPQPLPYRDHVAQVLAHARTQSSEAFFRRKLADIDEPTAPFGLIEVHGDGSRILEAQRRLPDELARRARAQARRLGVSAATLFHAAWGLVVAHASGRDDVVFGSVLLGRLQGGAGTQRILGMFINTLPLRIKLAAITAKDLVEQTQREVLELLSHEQASLALAQRCSGLAGSAPLFTALFNYRHTVTNTLAHWSSIQGLEALAVQERTNYPIALSVDDLGEAFSLTAQTDHQVDPARLTAYMEVAVDSLLSALEHAPNTPALSLTILPQSERRQVLELFNATAAQYPQDKLVHELFEAQAERAPNAPAVLFEGQSLTYNELNSRANQMAWHLASAGVKPGEFVPILMARSLQLLIAQLAVLKVGGIYLPMDPELPTERLTFMLRDCRTQTILADGEPPASVDPGSAKWIDCTALTDLIRSQPVSNLNVSMHRPAAAYVMYTSGSTGMPKGVIVPHHAINRLAINNGYADFAPQDCIAHHSNPAFDASTFEVWAALLNGATVLVVPQSVLLDVQSFAAMLERHRVTALYMSVGLFNQYADALGHVFTALRYLMVGGESLEPMTIRRVLRNTPPQQLLNVYGPTEGTTYSTQYRIESVDEDAKSIPIGKPIANTQVYVLDCRRQPVPIGVVGEAYIGGAGVACGYLNRPELDEERFVPDLFSVDPDARLYKTGDLAKWRADGVLEFIGRNDHQVKIRGFRIELGEIEARLSQHPAVREAVVLAREDVPGHKRLVAYLVARDVSAVPDVDELRTCLKSTLPEYMVPRAYVVLPEMLLTPTGKVHRRALPAPALEAYGGVQHEVPHGRTEQMLARIWAEILAVERLGRTDNFFELGAHSLLAIKALSMINEAFGSSLKVGDLYRCPTICELAARIEDGSSEDRLIDLAHEATLAADIQALGGLPRLPERAVLLTGATGFVGRFLLTELLKRTTATVYCLVRAPCDSQPLACIRTMLLKWDLWSDYMVDRIIAVRGDLRLPCLGLDPADYDRISSEVDSIYHCGTSMNHLETYEMAKPANVDSARELLRLASRRRPKIINYVSTLSVFSSATSAGTRTVDERSAIDQEKHRNSRGYAASKWVGEKIFMLAAERGIPCNIFRLGLVWADTHQGRYDELQREYRVMQSCLASGLGIRDYRYQMAPTPVDYVAQAIVCVAGRSAAGGGVFHICSPAQTINGVFERYNEIGETPLELLPLYDWICEMKRLHYAGESLTIVPLIEFAFSMDEESFYDYQRRNALSTVRVDSGRTHLELARSGIAIPAFDDAQLVLCMRNILAQAPSGLVRRNIRGT